MRSSQIGKIGDVSRGEGFCVTGGNPATSYTLHRDVSVELSLLLFSNNLFSMLDNEIVMVFLKLVMSLAIL